MHDIGKFKQGDNVVVIHCISGFTVGFKGIIDSIDQTHIHPIGVKFEDMEEWQHDGFKRRWYKVTDLKLNKEFNVIKLLNRIDEV